MPILLTILSILIITAAVWLIRRATSLKVCPICAGVALTWVWILAGIFLGKLPPTAYQLSAAILMGGSVVGVAYQLEKRPAFAEAATAGKAGKVLLFKVLFIPAGFGTVYAVISSSWLWAAAGVVYLLGIVLLFLALSRRPTEVGVDKNSERVAELEDKMKKCC